VKRSPADIHYKYAGTTSVTIHTSSQAPALGGTLANITGDIYVQGGGSTSLIVDDTGTTTDRTATVTDTDVTWQTPAAIHWVPGVVNSVTLNWGSGNDDFFANSTAAGVTTVINGGDGNDGFFCWSLDAIRGPLAFHGEGGLYDYPLLYDYGNPEGQIYTLTADRVQRLGKADITFDSMIQLILYTSGNGIDTVNVESVDVFTPIVLGNGDTLTLGKPVAGGGRTLQDIRGLVRPQSYGNGPVAVVIDNSGDPTPRQATFTYDPSDAVSGHVLSGLAPGPIYFMLDAASSLLVKGGLGDDSFRLPAVLPPVPLTIDGGGGTNTLDYSTLTSGVLVNLLAGTATGVAGLSRIQNVIGGAGNDVLIGNELANTLIGKGGNNILLGLGGNDRLYGGDGRDILIGGFGADWLGDDILNGGYTDYDTQISNGVARHDLNLDALNAVMAEWASSNTYNVRFGAIKTGVGVGGQYRLDPTTVHDDLASDTLIGGDGQDWFFIPKSGDTITDLDFNPSDLTNRKEKTTNIKGGHHRPTYFAHRLAVCAVLRHKSDRGAPGRDLLPLLATGLCGSLLVAPETHDHVKRSPRPAILVAMSANPV
jgi:RTX calcium-binding nonapeptide repeat (4 copies)